jgi:hypothetical protein
MPYHLYHDPEAYQREQQQLFPGSFCFFAVQSSF